jgi:hypothetical protein
MINFLIKLFSKKEKMAQEMLYDPFSHELIAKIAKDCDRYFEIVRPSDGYIIRCYPTNYVPPEQQNLNRDVW